MTASCSQYLLDLLAQVPDPRKKRGRRHPLAALLAVGALRRRRSAAPALDPLATHLEIRRLRG
jgi:hypothetical protein